jgi:predicted SAM-dependent methyltransferase
MISDIMQSRAFEPPHPNLLKQAFYRAEQRVGRLLARTKPPWMNGDQLLNLGCGPHQFPGWVNSDQYSFKRSLRERNFRPNWMMDATEKWHCPDDHWDGVFTEHVLEHVVYSQALFILRECHRTMKPGAWLRISVPSIEKYMYAYLGSDPAPEMQILPHRAIAVSFVTQMHEHRSTWDTSLLTQILGELGFVDVSGRGFGEGSDQRLLRDDPAKEYESLYVEARKA